jgi:uncharacterized DUF497 family protein
MNDEVRLIEVMGFDWDEYNRDKNKIKHNVTQAECEEVFINEAKYFEDQKHSKYEKRYTTYGATTSSRLLTIVFTIRENKIRVISARDQSKKEREVYKKYE